MKEVKHPKKQIIYFYIALILCLMAFNVLAVPSMSEQSVKEVDYGTFMKMTENSQIGEVQIESNEILFTNKDGSKTYKTGVMNDPNLTDRLYKSGATFATDIQQTMSPLSQILLYWILPLLLFIWLGQVMSKKMMDKAGGGNSMMFGMGKSNARVYVQSTEGIHFSDVAGEDEAKENLAEIVDYLHNPQKYADVGASMPKGVLLVGPPGTGKTMFYSSADSDLCSILFLQQEKAVRL